MSNKMPFLFNGLSSAGVIFILNSELSPIKEDIEHITKEITSLEEYKTNIQRNSNDIKYLNKEIISQNKNIRLILNKQNNILYSLMSIADTMTNIQSVLYKLNANKLTKENLFTKKIPKKVLSFLFNLSAPESRKQEPESRKQEPESRKQEPESRKQEPESEILDALSDL